MKCAGGVEQKFNKPCPKCSVGREGPCPTGLANEREAFNDMLEALKAVRPLMIPGMNWTDETGERIKRMVSTAIAKAEARS